MSRLFSRLENVSQDPNEGALPAESALESGVHTDAAFPSPAGNSSHTGMPSSAAPMGNSPGTLPLVPGYAIPSSLAVSPRPGPVATRPVWPVRLWLASLLLLVGLSLLMLAMPDRLLPLAVQRPAGATPGVSAASKSDATPTRPAAAAAPSASAVTGMVRPVVTAASAPRAEPRTRPVATPAAPAPAHPSGGPACSEAMLAMNLCSKSSP